VVNKFDNKFWVWTIVKFLSGSSDKKILEWQMNKKKNFWVFTNYTHPTIQAFIEALISVWFLEKSSWQYPLLKLTNYWRITLNREDYLKEENNAMQHFLKMKLWNKAFSKKNTKEKKVSKETYLETLKLFTSWKNIDEIANLRDLKKQTIENHIVKLYKDWKISLAEIMKLVKFSNLKEIKKIITDFFDWQEVWLREIRDKVEEYSQIKVERIEINIAKAMIEKWDL
jgi:superfamily II DNA helicase RecQ